MSGVIAGDYDEYLLSNTLWVKFYNIRYKPELNEYFHTYRCQLNFTMFCATSALVISWQHLNHPNLSAAFIRVILHDSVISSLHKDAFSKAKNFYIKSAYYTFCDDCGINAGETWMNGDWFYTTEYHVLGDGEKATKRSPPDNLIAWTTTQSRGYTWKGTGEISRSVKAYAYLVLTSQVQARSSIPFNLASVTDAQQVFKSKFYCID